MSGFRAGHMPKGRLSGRPSFYICSQAKLMSRQLDHGRETLMGIFHRHRQANEHDAAATALRCRFPSIGPKHSYGKASRPCRRRPSWLFIFCQCARALPERADVHALVGAATGARPLRDGHALPYKCLETSAQRSCPAANPLGGRSRSETPAELRRTILAHLPDIQTGKELGLVIKLLAAQSDAPGTIGVVRYLPEQKEIQGWAIDLQNLQAPAALQIEANGARINATASATRCLVQRGSQRPMVVCG